MIFNPLGVNVSFCSYVVFVGSVLIVIEERTESSSLLLVSFWQEIIVNARSAKNADRIDLMYTIRGGGKLHDVLLFEMFYIKNIIIGGKFCKVRKKAI